MKRQDPGTKIGGKSVGGQFAPEPVSPVAMDAAIPLAETPIDDPEFGFLAYNDSYRAYVATIADEETSSKEVPVPKRPLRDPLNPDPSSIKFLRSFVPSHCGECGEFTGKDEFHECKDTVDAIKKVYRAVWLKRAAVIGGLVGYSAFAIATGNALPVAIMAAVVFAAAPLLRKIRRKKEIEERGEMPYYLSSSFNDLKEKAKSIAEKVGVDDNVIVVYDNSEKMQAGYACVEQSKREEITIHVGYDMLSDMGSEERESILAHEIGHMSRRHLRNADMTFRGTSACAGMAAGAAVAAAGAPIIVASAAVAAVGIPLYLASQLIARAEERRADAIAYKLYGETYVRAMKSIDVGYKPGQRLPFGLSDIAESHPSLRNRVSAMRAVVAAG